MKKTTAKKLMKMTNELYEKEALSFDKTRSNLWEKEILEFVKKIKPNAKVLDLGCGNARLLPQIVSPRTTSFCKMDSILLLHKRRARGKRMTHGCPQIKYLGIDTSKELIGQNQKKYGRSLFKTGDGLKMKFKDRFDYVISIAVFHHIPSEKLQLEFLTNIHRTLKANGQILVTVWNRWQNRYKKYFISANPKSETLNPKQIQNLNSKNIKQLDYYDLDKNDQIVPWKQSGQFRYIHTFKPNELKNLAQKAGFKKIKVFASRMGKITNLDEALNIYLEAQK